MVLAFKKPIVLSDIRAPDEESPSVHIIDADGQPLYAFNDLQYSPIRYHLFHRLSPCQLPPPEQLPPKILGPGARKK
jgi:hypothetical protein